jgi:16S rRNA C967 or C1407 C5-methylase (RsmB/RsmF family)
MRSNELPADFLNTLESMLSKDGLNLYIESLKCGRVYGLRANPLKVTPEQLKNLLTCLTHDVPWLPEGFYFNPESRPTKSIWYHAGLFYVQEPSAMLPVGVAGIEPGHTVLDLCAAPGGKTTQAAGYLQGKGLIVANDISISRCKPLVKNIE